MATKTALDLEYEKASDALKYILDKNDNRSLNICADKLKQAYGPTQGEMLRKRTMIIIRDAIQATRSSSPKVLASVLTATIGAFADSQDPKYATNPAQAEQDASAAYTYLDKRHNAYCPNRSRPSLPSRTYLPGSDASP